jgi:hypothetical protein
MECLVTGIAPTSDAAQVEALLSKTQYDPERLAIITKSAAQGRIEGHAGGPSFSSAATIMTGSEGTSVPGMGGSGASLSAFSHGTAIDYLGGLPFIPPDQAQNYNIAIAEGRSLVTYKASAEEAPTIEAAFREAGLRKVKTFR